MQRHYSKTFFLSRSEELAPPTAQDYLETKKILHDFRINATVPHFSCASTLLRWRSELVRAAIGSQA